MARRTPPDARPRLADPPSNVRVTVVPGPRGRAARDRSATIRSGLGLPVLVGLVALVAGAGAILTEVSLRDSGAVRARVARSAPRVEALGVPRAGVGDAARMAGVAAAFRYPLGCLGITLSAERSSMLGRHSPCWRYGVYVTAVLRQVKGVWRLTLQATSPKCPDVALPEIVRSALAVCRRAEAPSLGKPPPAVRLGRPSTSRSLG